MENIRTVKVTKQGVRDLGNNGRQKKKELPPLDGSIDQDDYEAAGKELRRARKSAQRMDEI